MRILLAEVAAAQPHLMILDEPTNHLDIYTIETLISALNDFDGGVLFSTHNRHFLDEVADEILNICEGKCELEKVDLEADVVHVSGMRRSNWREG